jgi:chromosome segregation ATPase
VFKEPKFPQPSGFKALSHDPDEIPGDSNVIYSENRLREPHEYRGYLGNESYQQLNAIKEYLGLKKEDSFDELLQTLYHDTNMTEHTEAKLEIAKDENFNLRTQNALLHDQLVATDKTIEKLNKKYKNEERERKEIKAYLMQYGTHLSSCNWIKMLQAGRLYGTVEEICDCGWIKLKEKY